MVRAGTESGHTGICGGRTVTTTVIMDALVGNGAATGELVCTYTATGVCGATIKAGGVGFVRTGISGSAIIITDQHDGSGAAIAVWDGIFIGCVFSSVGLVQNGS